MRQFFISPYSNQPTMKRIRAIVGYAFFYKKLSEQAVSMS